jgi:phage shock protein B
MDAFEFVLTLVITVLGFVTWWVMLLSRKEKRRSTRLDVEAEARYSLNELSAMAESLQDRIDTLESILDAEVPNWREHNEPSSR